MVTFLNNFLIVFVSAFWNFDLIWFDNLPKKYGNGFQLKMYPLMQDVVKFRSICEKYKMDIYPELNRWLARDSACWSMLYSTAFGGFGGRELLVCEFPQCVEVLRLMVVQSGGENNLICLEHQTEWWGGAWSKSVAILNCWACVACVELSNCQICAVKLSQYRPCTGFFFQIRINFHVRLFN